MNKLVALSFLCFFLAAAFIPIVNTQTSNISISEDSKEIFKDQKKLKVYIGEYGPKKTILRLASLREEFGSCHDAAHKTGQYSYQLFGNEAFNLCANECHYGCLHGVTESYFNKNGTEDWLEKIEDICRFSEGVLYKHSCYHGLGHILMSWLDYDLPKALESCSSLKEWTGSCYTGALMENIVITEEDAHKTKYITSDPQYPCNFIDKQYKSACYVVQPTRMLQLFSGDFSKTIEECQKAPIEYQENCLFNVGREVAMNSVGEAEKVFNVCKMLKSNLIGTCVNGAVDNWFWEMSGQDNAINLCRRLEDKSSKDSCYIYLFERVEILTNDNGERAEFCTKTEDYYKNFCIKRLVGV